VATTDSIPWLAVLGKLLSPALSADFQYFGLYLAACFALQGAVGARLTSLVSERLLLQALGAAVFVVSPVLFARLGHTALCGQWVVLLALDANLRPRRDLRQAARTAALLGGALLFASGVHPYLACMALPLAWSFLWCCARDRVVSWRWAAAVGSALAATVVAAFLLFGYVGGREPPGATGFGDYSADLLALVNPAGRSRFLPPAPVSALQAFEGFGYLGLGVLGLVAVLAAVLAARRRLPAGWRRALPLAVVALGWFFYALSWRVTLAGTTVATLSRAYAPLASVTGALRSSGRFVWPLHYAVTAAAVLGWLRWQRRRPAVAAGGLAVVVAVQLAETWTLATVAEATAGTPHLQAPPAMDVWSGFTGYPHLALMPARVGFQPDPEGRELQARLGYVAYRLGATFNSGYTARIDWGVVHAATAPMLSEVESGKLRPDTLYVFVPPRPAREEWRCQQVEGLQVCASGATDSLSGK
jgi:hypothetical protein